MKIETRLLIQTTEGKNVLEKMDEKLIIVLVSSKSENVINIHAWYW